MLAKRYVFMKKKIHKKATNAIALGLFSSILALLVWGSKDRGFSFGNVMTSAAEAVQLRDGKTYFINLPMLIEAETTVNRIYARNATYYFAIALPQNMGEPLQKLEISQKEGFDSIDFFENDTLAYVQSPSGERVGIASKTEIVSSGDRSEDRNKITITFNPSIPASGDLNRKLIVGLRPISNPRTDGTYLFGVTAFPQGDRPNSQFLGYGRLSFYSLRF